MKKFLILAALTLVGLGGVTTVCRAKARHLAHRVTQLNHDIDLQKSKLRAAEIRLQEVSDAAVKPSRMAKAGLTYNQKATWAMVRLFEAPIRTHDNLQRSNGTRLVQRQ